MAEEEERDAFYQAIMDSWEDDTPRLIYADWLDEQGDKVSSNRAELIRLQCEISQLLADNRKVARATSKKEQRLSELVREDLCAYGLDKYYYSPNKIRFFRGFIAPGEYDEENSHERAIFLAIASEAWKILGPIDEPGQLFSNFDFTADQPNTPRIKQEFSDLADSPALRYWRSIRIGVGGDTIGEDNFVTLLSSQRLLNLRTLEVKDQARSNYEEHCYPLSKLALKTLASNSAFSGLASITIWWSGMDDAGLRTLGRID